MSATGLLTSLYGRSPIPHVSFLVLGLILCVAALACMEHITMTTAYELISLFSFSFCVLLN
jgi:hypothetical protein